MKKLEKALKGHKYICFLDFEGTQLSHEMIAIGAIFVYLDKHNRIKKTKEPFKCYVKAKNKIGTYVAKLTGISDAKIEKDGISFSKAMQELKKYCGLGFKKCTFSTFGNHDLKILSQSIAYNFDAPIEITSQIQKNYMDFQLIIDEFVRDENYNPMSLVNYCKLFHVKEAGVAHDPEVDAINLAHLYDAFLEQKDLVLEEYLKLLTKVNTLPYPVKRAMETLASGNEYTPDDLRKDAKEYIS